MNSPGGGAAGGGTAGDAGGTTGVGGVVGCAGLALTPPNTFVNDPPAGAARPGDDARGIVGGEAGGLAGGAMGGIGGRVTGTAPNAAVKLPGDPLGTPPSADDSGGDACAGVGGRGTDWMICVAAF